MAFKNTCFKRIVDENIGIRYSHNYYSNKSKKQYRIQTEFTDSISSFAIEAKSNDIYHQDGVLYDIYTEEKSLKMITVLRDENFDVIGAGVLVSDTDYGTLPIDDGNYFGIYHIYLSEDHRGLSLSNEIVKSALTLLEEKYISFSEDPPMVAIQKHVHQLYRSKYDGDTIIIPYEWIDMDLNYPE